MQGSRKLARVTETSAGTAAGSAPRNRLAAAYWGWLLIVLVVGPLSGCNYSAVTSHLPEERRSDEYRYGVVQERSGRGQDDGFFAAAFSGGGMRAAALAYGALKAVEQTRSPDNLDGTTPPGTLMDEFDLVTAVSGGSVTAAYWALTGREGYHRLKGLFLDEDVRGELLKSTLLSLAALPTPQYSRIDVLRGYLESTLFGQATYGDLLERRNRPYLVINATDMGTRSLFPFIQLQMDLICSDLRRIKIAEAVTASAAYPIAFPALTFYNHRAEIVGVEDVPISAVDASCLKTTIVDDLEDSQGELAESVGKIEGDLAEATMKVEGLVRELDNARDEVHRLVAEHAQAKRQVLELNNDLTEAKGVVAELQGRRDAAIAEVEGLEQKYGEVQGKVEGLEAQQKEAREDAGAHEAEIQRYRDGESELEIDDPVFVFVTLWWEAIVQREHPDAEEVLAATRGLLESHNAFEEVQSERGPLEAEEGEEEEPGARERKWSAARAAFREQAERSLPFLIKHCADWVKGLDEGDIAKLLLEDEARLSETVSEAEEGDEAWPTVAGQATLDKWIRWLSGLDQERAPGELGTSGFGRVVELVRTHLRLREIEVVLDELRGKLVNLGKELVPARSARDSLTVELANAVRRRDELIEKVQEAQEIHKEVSGRLVVAENERDKLKRALAKAEAREQELKEALDIKKQEVHDLKLYLERVEAIQAEYASASENLKRQLQHYGAADSDYVHLMDGGVADNLGFSPLLELLEGFEKAEGTIVGDALVLVVDARREPTYEFANNRAPPGVIDTIVATTSTAIDSKSFLLANELERVTERLKDKGVITRRYIVDVGFEQIRERRARGRSTDVESDGDGTSPERKEPVDECQRWFENIETDWTLPTKQVEALIAMGEALVRESESFTTFLSDSGREVSPPSNSVSSICEGLTSGGGPP